MERTSRKFAAGVARWLGCAALVVAGLAIAPAPAAHADPVCAWWSASIGTVTPTGPGTVTAAGKVSWRPLAGRTYCAGSTYLVGYATEADAWSKEQRPTTGQTFVPVTGGVGVETVFDSSLSLGAGTSAVCLVNHLNFALSCFKVTVKIDGESGGPGIPEVLGRIQRPAGVPGDGGIGECGTCV